MKAKSKLLSISISKISGLETTIFSLPPNVLTLDSRSPNDLATDRPPGFILHGPNKSSRLLFFYSFAYLSSE